MSLLDRRSLMRRTAQSILLLSFVPPMAARAQGQPLGQFDPPSTPMIYSRQLLRIMTGGARLMVTRSFAVRFIRDADGYLVTGTQTGVAVEAPPALDRFAALEKERLETGLFPLRLDMAGQITGAQVPTGPAPQQDDRLALAVAAARSVATQMQAEPEVQAQLAAFINAVHQSATQLVTQLPPDLFAPQQLARTERQQLDLPGDLVGQVTAQFSASVDPATGLMRNAQRSVTTAIGPDQRETVESWTLKPA